MDQGTQASWARLFALALVPGSILATGCLFSPDDSSEEAECLDATTELPHDGTFELEGTGQRIELGPIVAGVEGRTSGVLEWSQVGRSTDVTLTIEADAGERVTVFGDCDTYRGIDIPAHLELTSADGVLADRFGGHVSLDEAGRVIGSPVLDVPIVVSQLQSVLPAGFGTTPDTDWHLRITPELGPEEELPFVAATIVLTTGWTGSDPVQSVTLGVATFGGTR